MLTRVRYRSTALDSPETGPEMNTQTLALILVSVALSSSAQILLKLGMSTPAMGTALASGDPRVLALGVAMSPWVIAGLSCHAAAAAVWLLVLARVDVSMAYPFIGLGFVSVMLIGRLLFGDELGVTRVAGTLMVVAGVVLIARS